MARIIGIDLGAHSVKVTFLQIGFRSVTLASVQDFEVLPGAEPPLERALRALSGLALQQEHDGVTVGFPGDRVLLRRIEVPFSDPRKLQPVIANELADDMPWEMEDVVFDFTALPAPVNGALVAAARSDEVAALLAALESHGVEPRHLAAAPIGYAELIRRLHPQGLVAVADLGHLRSNVCVVMDGRAVAARTISRGGHQLTEALRQVFQLSYAEAQELKERRGTVAVDPSTLPPEARKLAEVMTGAMAPLVRELQQTLRISASRLRAKPEQLLLCGGTSLLGGVEELLSAELGVPTTRLSLGSDPELAVAGLDDEGEAVGALSIGLALDHGRGRTLDLRRGQFAFQSDRSIFRDKLLTLVASVMAILILAGVSAYASISALHSEEQALTKRLREETTRIFGSPASSASVVLRKLKKGKNQSIFAIPPKTALDILQTLSARIPPGKEVKIDVTRLDIKPGKTYIKGVADSQSSVGKVVKSLKQDDCFGDVSAGKISATGDGKKQFTLNVATKCF